MSEINNSEFFQAPQDIGPLTFRERVGKFFGKPVVDYAPDYHELSDNLKIDISILNPSQESVLQDKVLSANKHLLEALGMFIPESTIERNKEINKKVIVTSEENFEEYASSVFGLPISDVPEITFKALAQPGAIVMMQPSNQRYFNRILSHELIHMYQSQYPPDKSKLLSFYFREAGAYFYARKLYPNSPSSSKDDRVFCNLYSRLADKHGDNLHKLFFGQPILESDRKQIMRDFKNSKLE